MLCCMNSSYSGVPTDESSRHWTCFPAWSRSTLSASRQPPADTVLLKTGGNALQAVDRSTAESDNVISVCIPENVKPGQTILAKVHDGRSVSVVIPEGAFPGHTLLVNVPPPSVVTGVPVDESEILAKSNETDDLLLMEGEWNEAKVQSPSGATHSQQQKGTNASAGNNTANQQQHDTVLVQVPAGAKPGSKIRIQLPDHRVVDVVVPAGEVSQFHVQVPRANNRQNWHDSPAAYAAPMVVAPLLM